MTWIITVDGEHVTSDDFTIADLENVEKSTGTPWSVANPLRDVKVAKAFLAVAMLKAGRSEEQVLQRLTEVTLRTLKDTFTYRSDDDETTTGEAHQGPLDRPAPTSHASSPGRRAKDGSRATPASRPSATS